MGFKSVQDKLTLIGERLDKIENARKDAEQKKLNTIAKGISMSGTNRVGSDEARALMYFGVSHVKDLLNVNVAAERFKAVPAELKHLVLELKRDVDVARMSMQVFHGERLDRDDERPAHVKGVLDGNYYGKNVLAPKLKAFSSDTGNVGGDWIPTAISSQYIEEYQLERRVAAQFREITMPTSPFKMPVQSGTTKARIQAESSTISGTNFNTGALTFDAVKLAEFMKLPEELNEDTAPEILGIIRSEVVMAQIRALEDAILNGDNSGTHMDTDTAAGGADLAAKAWKGLRKLALANSANGGTVDFSGAAITTAKLRTMRSQMGKFGVNPRELAWIVSAAGWVQMMNLAEVITVDKFGPMASILQGALAAFDGIPIVISENMRDDLDATGVNGAAANTFTGVQLVNHRRFYVGQRRPIRTKAVQDPTPPNDQWLVASTWRGTFVGHTQGTSEVSSVLGYNIP